MFKKLMEKIMAKQYKRGFLQEIAEVEEEVEKIAEKGNFDLFHSK